jgi:hypothetical protein
VAWWVRIGLVVFAAGLVAVFTIAALIHPYTADGQALKMGAHTRLGMPPCEFYVAFGKPCPSCGLTTRFALFIRGDLGNAFRANWVGPLLALVGMGSVPWSLWIAIRGRYLWTNSIERASLWVGGALFMLLLVRWGFAL